MTHGSLFSGIGGFDLAAQWAGFENVFQVEIDPFCRKVLEKNFPNVKRYTDIKEFNGKEYEGAVDIISGGFPCQPFSCAGKRRGKADDRFLWPEMLRVISEIKPRFVVGENVAGIVNMELDSCLSDLESQGYETETYIIPACAIGAPHRRNRVWIIAYSKSNRNRRNKREVCKTNGRQNNELHERPENADSHAAGTTHNTKCEQEHPTTERGLHAMSCSSDSHAANTGCLRQTEYEKQTTGVKQYNENASHPCGTGLQGGEWTGTYEQGQAAYGPVAERISAWNEHWYTVALRTCVRDLDDGIPGRLARPKGWRVNSLKAMGNAVVPQIPYIIFEAIKRSTGE